MATSEGIPSSIDIEFLELNDNPYYIFHLFLGLALHEFPAIEAKMPRENSFHSIMLGDALARTFCQEQWQDLIDHVSIHKFNFRKVEEALKNPHSYCAYMVAQRL